MERPAEDEHEELTKRLVEYLAPPEEPLYVRLVSRASEFAQLAGRAIIDDKPHHYAIYAGAATELLFKAVLAKLHPSAIADPRHFDSLLALSGFRQYALKSSDPIKTISGRDAFARCRQVVPDIVKYEAQLLTLIDYRNGAIHFVGGESALSDDTLLAFYGFVREVVTFLGETTDRILGEFGTLFAQEASRLRSEAEKVPRESYLLPNGSTNCDFRIRQWTIETRWGACSA